VDTCPELNGTAGARFPSPPPAWATWAPRSDVFGAAAPGRAHQRGVAVDCSFLPPSCQGEPIFLAAGVADRSDLQLDIVVGQAPPVCVPFESGAENPPYHSLLTAGAEPLSVMHETAGSAHRWVRRPMPCA